MQRRRHDDADEKRSSLFSDLICSARVRQVDPNIPTVHYSGFDATLSEGWEGVRTQDSGLRIMPWRWDRREGRVEKHQRGFVGSFLPSTSNTRPASRCATCDVHNLIVMHTNLPAVPPIHQTTQKS
nr:hypothetical protein CFP56_68172 [Quercus suber]